VPHPFVRRDSYFVIAALGLLAMTGAVAQTPPADGPLLELQHIRKMEALRLAATEEAVGRPALRTRIRRPIAGKRFR
jgi:hypothetical protein